MDSLGPLSVAVVNTAAGNVVYARNQDGTITTTCLPRSSADEQNDSRTMALGACCVAIGFKAKAVEDGEVAINDWHYYKDGTVGFGPREAGNEISITKLANLEQRVLALESKATH